MYKRTSESISKWRKAIAKRLKKGPIDRSRCGLPRNKPEDVWKYINKRGPDDCWEWTSGRHKGGYGAFRIDGRYYKAHRIVYALEYGEIEYSGPESNYAKTHVLHKCDNPPCCNPRHLYIGDIWDNMRDKVERGRVHRGGRKTKGQRICPLKEKILGSVAQPTKPPMSIKTPKD